MNIKLMRLAQAERDPRCLPPPRVNTGRVVPLPFRFQTDADILAMPLEAVETVKNVIERQAASRQSSPVTASHPMMFLRKLDFPIYWIGRQWAVTGYGIEEIALNSYHLKKDGLNDPYLPEHMAEKDWVDIEDFMAALDFAMQLFRCGAVNKSSPKAQVRSNQGEPFAAVPGNEDDAEPFA